MNVFAADADTQKQRTYIKKYVEYARSYIQRNGLVNSVQAFNNSKRDATQKALYIFGFVCGTPKMDGFSLINPGIPSRIYADVSNEPVIQALIKASLEHPDGVWVRYNWLNPVTKKVQHKESYMLYLPEVHLCIGSGFYS
jgi:signal transduction histidine kinase